MARGKKHNLTDSVVRALPVPSSSNKLFYDAKVPGLAARVSPKGARYWVFNYCINGTERRVTLGRVEDFNSKDARKWGAEQRAKVLLGIDPAIEKEERERKARAERKAPRVADLADRYKEDYLPKKRPRSQAEDLSLLRVVEKEHRDFWRTLVTQATFADVDSLHRATTKVHGPFRANRVLSLLSKMFNLAIKWQYRPDNPCRGIERNAEPPRRRYLSDAELTRLFEALDAERDQQGADFYRLAVLTGARVGELRGMEWSHVDLDRGLWIKPHLLTKQKEEHHLPLSAEAVEILRKMPRTGRFVFSKRASLEPRSQDSFRSVWDRLRDAANLKDVRQHDLRHTHASLLVNKGYSLEVIGALLGHRNISTTQRYSHLSDSTLREAVGRLGDVIRFPKKGAA